MFYLVANYLPRFISNYLLGDNSIVRYYDGLTLNVLYESSANTIILSGVEYNLNTHNLNELIHKMEKEGVIYISSATESIRGVVDYMISRLYTGYAITRFLTNKDKSYILVAKTVYDYIILYRKGNDASYYYYFSTHARLF